MSNLQKISLLTFIEKIGTDRAIYLCKCGNKKEARISSVKNLHTCSCGCLNKARASKMATKHGLSKHPLWRVWRSVKSRCSNKNVSGYKDYGGRGITICEEWSKSFYTFYQWCISNGYSKGLQIDRENNNGNYEPSNCRFVTRKVNCNNKRNNLVYEINGVTKNLKQWCETLNLKYGTVKPRIRKWGWCPYKALGVIKL